MSYTETFAKEKFESHQQWIKDNLLLETIMGSQAYGVQTKTSDIDFIALVMPKKEHLYPQQYGYIPGFEQCPNFEYKDLKGDSNKLIINKIETEGEWVSIVRFFFLTGIKGSPAYIESLFAKDNLVTFNTKIGSMVRDNRKKFVSMRVFNALKGYTFQQLQRIRNSHKTGKSDNPKRHHLLDDYNFDTKQSYHPLRLLDELNQLLDTGEIDLMRNRDECISMRNGTWGNFEKFESTVLKRLELIEEKALKNSSNIPSTPNVGSLKVLLQECIEEYYGNLNALSGTDYEFISTKDVMEKLEKIYSCVDKSYRTYLGPM
jgi:uncharacterized protein